MRPSLPRHLRADRGPPQAYPAQGRTYADESQLVRALLDLAVATAISAARRTWPKRSGRNRATTPPVVKENRPHRGPRGVLHGGRCHGRIEGYRGWLGAPEYLHCVDPQGRWSDLGPHCKSITARSTQVRDDTVIRDEHTAFRYSLGLCSAGSSTGPGPNVPSSGPGSRWLADQCTTDMSRQLLGTCGPLLDVVVYIHVAARLFVFGLFRGAGFVTVIQDMPQTPVACQSPY